MEVQLSCKWRRHRNSICSPLWLFHGACKTVELSVPKECEEMSVLPPTCEHGSALLCTGNAKLRGEGKKRRNTDLEAAQREGRVSHGPARSFFFFVYCEEQWNKKTAKRICSSSSSSCSLVPGRIWRSERRIDRAFSFSSCEQLRRRAS